MWPRRSRSRLWLASYLVIVKGTRQPSTIDFPTTGQLHDPPDRSVPGLLPARGLRSVPRADLRPSTPSVTGRARHPARLPPKVAASVLGFLGTILVVGFLAVAASFRSSPRLTAPPRSRSASATNLYLPFDGFTVACRQTSGDAVTLSWPTPAAERRHPCARYAIFRDPTDRAICVPVKHAAANCAFNFGRSASAAVKGCTSRQLDHLELHRSSCRPAFGPTGVALSATPVEPAAASPGDYIADQPRGAGHRHGLPPPSH